jgi:hypothetical protein
MSHCDIVKAVTNKYNCSGKTRRIIEKLEVHYTPKHGSWLNMAEIELSVLQRQSLKARIPDQATLVDGEGGCLAKSTQYFRCHNKLALYYRRCTHQITPLISDNKSWLNY